jgi:formylglycine-generating enzyme required for sulfatase activity
MIRSRGASRWVVAAGAILIVSVGLGIGIPGDRGDGGLVEAARRAVAAGDWAAGFLAYLGLFRAGSDEAEVEAGLEATAARLMDSLPEESSAVQRDLVGWLAADGDGRLLATALDRCTAPITAGWFLMGSAAGRPNERPERRVYLDAFRIDRYEVTNAQYQRFVALSGRAAPPHWRGGLPPAGTAAHPVLAVGWDDAAAYCSWAGRRLPTEAEWERACRGTDGRTYPWGDTWDPSLANIASGLPLVETQPRPTDPAWRLVAEPQPAGGLGPRPVGSLPGGASPEGVLDLAGNAAEWVGDWYGWDGYAGLPERNPVAAGPPWNHVVRGAGWLDPWARPDWVARDARCSARDSSHVTVDVRFGFRCAIDGLAVPSDPPAGSGPWEIAVATAATPGGSRESGGLLLSRRGEIPPGAGPRRAARRPAAPATGRRR